MLLRNNHNGTFTDVTFSAGVSNERWGFGVAVGDYDNHGWPDIYVANYGKKNENHWITIKLIGGAKSPRDAIGSKVFLTSGGARQRGDVISGGSYGSSSDQRVHFDQNRQLGSLLAKRLECAAPSPQSSWNTCRKDPL